MSDVPRVVDAVEVDLTDEFFEVSDLQTAIHSFIGQRQKRRLTL